MTTTTDRRKHGTDDAGQLWKVGLVENQEAFFILRRQAVVRLSSGHLDPKQSAMR